MAPVLLLRAPTPPDDRYASALARAGFTPVAVPVLETALVNARELRALVRAGPGAAGVRGVVVTSARAGEAWASAVGGSEDEDEDENEAPHADWRTTPFYAVGPATASFLTSIASTHAHAPAHARLCPADIRGGAETGTAELLARFILHDVAAPAQARLLYLTGDKNRETLPAMLEQGGVALRALQVYATRGAAGFEGALRRAMQSAPEEQQQEPWWIVYFAPSAAAHVTPALRAHFALPGVDDAQGKPRARVAAIGPTTAEFLGQELGLRVDAVPAKPSAEALVRALEEAG
ncbi:tetrapyrrole biosynthesis, uroporphyrinogen III synthase [Dentipellis sp. KUC8613]|nr:tetrapyrrole biosynthesis, uroporphyrinogen III synthase [Dentipellis sp. KUC8613]